MRLTHIGALDGRPVPMPRHSKPVERPRVVPIPIEPLSPADQDRLFDYQRRPRTHGLLGGLLPPVIRSRRGGTHVSPHRFSQHVFAEMGVVPTRTGSEAIVEVLVSARVFTMNRHVGNLDNLDRALAQLALEPEQRVRIASIVHGFAWQSKRRRVIEFKMLQVSTLISEREAYCARAHVPDNVDTTLLQLQVQQSRLKALMDARPSYLLPPPRYEDDVSPPDYDA